MKRIHRFHRTAAAVLLASLVFGFAGPFSWSPRLEAASSSASARLIKRLKAQIASLKRQLAAATAVPAPFLEMVPVGNPGNVADAGNTSTPGVHGAVPYEFRIGKHEVTWNQYAVFLNAVAATDTYGLYHPSMQTDPSVYGIQRTGTSGAHTYTVVGDGNRPVTYVSWFDAARFCNWLHNGRPSGAQTAATTEMGAYPLNGATSGALSIQRNPGARYWIPSEAEWYKAAYHDPRTAAQGGPTGNDFYWLFPTRSDVIPTAEAPPGGINSVNINTSTGGPTPVGAYPSAPSYYGTFDQGGNAWEWNDRVIYGTVRGLRGGSWNSNEDTMRSNFLSDDNVPERENQVIGFRVAAP
jgi:formylglycine-generating enzyme required for sulfatase activity